MTKEPTKLAEAIQTCRDWFAHLERQRAKALRLQQLATLARKGPEEAKQAQKELRQIDRQHKVYDGGRLEPAVRLLVDALEQAND